MENYKIGKVIECIRERTLSFQEAYNKIHGGLTDRDLEIIDLLGANRGHQLKPFGRHRHDMVKLVSAITGTDYCQFMSSQPPVIPFPKLVGIIHKRETQTISKGAFAVIIRIGVIVKEDGVVHDCSERIDYWRPASSQEIIDRITDLQIVKAMEEVIIL